MDGTKIPLVTAAAELCVDATELARRLADQITVDTSTGLRVIPASICRDLIAQKAAQAAARAEQQQTRREAARLRDETTGVAAQRRQLRARAQHHQALLEIDPNQPALALLTADDHQRRMDRAGRRWDDLIRAERTGELAYQSISPPRAER